MTGMKESHNKQPYIERVVSSQSQCTGQHTMPERVQSEADAMWGTMTAFSHSASPGFMAGSSSNTSRPTLPPCCAVYCLRMSACPSKD